jgi:hypothetical protein
MGPAESDPGTVPIQRARDVLSVLPTSLPGVGGIMRQKSVGVAIPTVIGSAKAKDKKTADSRVTFSNMIDQRTKRKQKHNTKKILFLLPSA